MERKVRMPRALTWTVAIYRVVLRLYPAAFVKAFGGELVRDMEMASDESWRAGRWRALVVLWARTLVDLGVSVVVQWTRTGWPVATWVTGASTAGALAVAWYVYRGAWRLARTRDDDEVAVLLVAVSAVLLVVVCTLTFTLWLVRPRRSLDR